MTAIIDGVTVIGTPEDINSLINLRKMPNYKEWQKALEEMKRNPPEVNYASPTLNSVVTACNGAVT